MIEQIAIPKLIPHSGNPRLAPREDVVSQIVAQLNGKMDDAHALIVRPLQGGYQIISGHHRVLAATQAGLKTVPCWVREMTDEDAYMALVLNNAQSELHPLEVGMHALKSGLSIRDYAKKIGAHEAIIQKQVQAARVVVHMYDQWSGFFAGPPEEMIAAIEELGGEKGKEYWRCLAEIHAAPSWAWRVLVEALLEEGWTVEATRKQVGKFKGAEEEPAPWIATKEIATHILQGQSNPTPAMLRVVEDARKQIQVNSVKQEEYLTALDQCLTVHGAFFFTVSSVQATLAPILNAQLDEIKQQRETERQATQEQEERVARVSRLRRFCSLEEWEVLSPEEQTELLTFTAPSSPSFNKQENADIEWAQWSWNPVSGCLHSCTYCYARDIANQKRMEKVYPHGFAPTLRPLTLLAPQGQRVPKEAETDTRYRNVFVCSMADLFGRWVPEAWIHAVLTQVRASPQWNFLFLTKFPHRMTEFAYPPNAWLGTTVDLQARVAAAEKAFANVNAPVRWLSIEPLIEPLRFTHLDRFHWMVIGGSSRSSHTPEWKPPFAWIYDLVQQARDADVKVYFKSNLLGCPTRILELPFDAPVTPENLVAPDIFHYLKEKDERPA